VREIALDQPLHLPDIPAILSHQRRLLIRLLECLPLCTAILVISSLVWGPILAPTAFIIAILVFHTYWLWRTMMNGAHAMKGYRLLNRYKNADWRAKFDKAKAEGKTPFAWDEIRHIVIVPNYTESIEKLRMGLDSIARSPIAGQIVVVLAMEAREGEPGRDKATRLIEEYRGRVGRILAEFHPFGLPGEIVGKSSNENWAARRAKEQLIDIEGGDIDKYTITSCDVDTVFHENHFPSLTYHFATNPNRYRRFWQGPIFYYNNIWHVPAPMRLPHALSGMVQLGRLSRSFFRMIMPQSTYTLSLRMANEVGYWDPDIIPEDWHMFLKCYYACGGEVEVETIYSPIYMDGIRSKNYVRTYVSYYEQAKRHAWGATDIPYSMCQVLDHPEIPLYKRLRYWWGVTEAHLLWTTQWALITLGRTVPFGLAALGLVEFPAWFKPLDQWLLVPCGGTLLLMLILDAKMRPPRPKEWKPFLYPIQYGQYFLMAGITFLSGTLPGLEAQTRLAIGKRLEYRVTEKA